MVALVGSPVSAGPVDRDERPRDAYLAPAWPEQTKAVDNLHEATEKLRDHKQTEEFQALRRRQRQQYLQLFDDEDSKKF